MVENTKNQEIFVLIEDFASGAYSQADRIKLELGTLEARLLECEEFTCIEGVASERLSLELK